MAPLRTPQLASICAILLAFVACDHERRQAAPERSVEASTHASSADDAALPRKIRAGDLEAIELVTAGAHASDTLPMIVAVHGMGDKPENWLDFFEAFPVQARVILPRAPMPWGEGASWFTYPPKSIEDLARGVSAAGARIARAIAELEASRPTKGKAILTGFSQGGFESFDVAVEHPDVIAAAFPMSGALPLPLVPASADAAKNVAPIFAVHGDADPIVPIQLDRDGVAKLKALGVHVELQEFPRIQHTVTPAMKRAVMERVLALASGDAGTW